MSDWQPPCEVGASLWATAVELRAAVIAEARTWIGTPYHDKARKKGAGVDCLTLLAEVYAAAGVIAPVTEIPFYRLDAFRHRGDETYLEELLARGREVVIPEPGDVALFKMARLYFHSAIVVAWPDVIHADADNGVIPANAETTGILRRLRPVKFISPF